MEDPDLGRGLWLLLATCPQTLWYSAILKQTGWAGAVPQGLQGQFVGLCSRDT